MDLRITAIDRQITLVLFIQWTFCVEIITLLFGIERQRVLLACKWFVVTEAATLMP
jgi:hypothetical protein